MEIMLGIEAFANGDVLNMTAADLGFQVTDMQDILQMPIITTPSDGIVAHAVDIDIADAYPKGAFMVPIDDETDDQSNLG